MAAEQGNHWAWFECLSRLSMLDLAGGNLAAVEERNSQLCDVAEKLGEGSERAWAATLLALARRQAGDNGARLEEALTELRAADSKGLLACALVEAGCQDLANGHTAEAINRADEALAAADDVGRFHQYDRAMMLKARAALLSADEETTEQYLQWLATRIRNLSPDLSIHGALCQLREDIIQTKEQ